MSYGLFTSIRSVMTTIKLSPSGVKVSSKNVTNDVNIPKQKEGAAVFGYIVYAPTVDRPLYVRMVIWL